MVWHSRWTFPISRRRRKNGRRLPRPRASTSSAPGRASGHVSTRRAAAVAALDALLAHEDAEGVWPLPATHPDRKAERAPTGRGGGAGGALKAGVVAPASGGRLSLTAGGRERRRSNGDQLVYPDGLPEDPAFPGPRGGDRRGRVGAEEDAKLFPSGLRVLVRTARSGSEMEGRPIGELGGSAFREAGDPGQGGERSRRSREGRQLPRVRLPGLGDRADGVPAEAPGSRAEVEVGRTWRRGRQPSSATRSVGISGFEDRARQFSRARVARVALLRDPGAASDHVRRRRAPAPFAGVLEVAVADGLNQSIYGSIGALDQNRSPKRSSGAVRGAEVERLHPTGEPVRSARR